MKMKPFLVTVYTGALLALMVSCIAVPRNTHDADMKALKDYQDEWYKIFEAKDVEKLTAVFEEDGVAAGSTGAVQGKEAIRRMWKDFLSDPAVSVKGKVARIEVSKSGDLAYIWGSYTVTTTDPNSKKPISENGSYVTVYKKHEGGSWKIAIDINTTK